MNSKSVDMSTICRQFSTLAKKTSDLPITKPMEVLVNVYFYAANVYVHEPKQNRI